MWGPPKNFNHFKVIFGHFTLFHFKNLPYLQKPDLRNLPETRFWLPLVNKSICTIPPSWATPDINIMAGESCVVGAFSMIVKTMWRFVSSSTSQPPLYNDDRSGGNLNIQIFISNYWKILPRLHKKKGSTNDKQRIWVWVTDVGLKCQFMKVVVYPQLVTRAKQQTSIRIYSAVYFRTFAGIINRDLGKIALI